MIQPIARTILAFCLLCQLLLTQTGAALAQSGCTPAPSLHQRMGVNVERTDGRTIDSYNTALLEAGWYHDYSINPTPSRVNGMQHVQMVRATIDTTKLEQLLGPALAANPGALWILGNEPDRFSQDGVTAGQYAAFYHSVYTFLKARDPSAQVAIGGILQPTPLRLLYLDTVLSEYAARYGAKPAADAWHIHNFILREAEDWGAYYPPGFISPPYTNANGATVNGRVYDVEDHGDLETFKEQIRDFRRWMADNGYRDKPLIVSEYGILLPEPFGYPYETVRDFMLGTFDFFVTETDPLMGNTQDGNRLVQKWAWFTLNDDYEFNGSLFDYDTGAITRLGQEYATYANSMKAPGMDLAIGALEMGAQRSTGADGTSLLTARVDLHNSGAHRAQSVLVRLWNGDPLAGGELLASAPSVAFIEPMCSQTQRVELSTTVSDLLPGVHTLFMEALAQSGARDNSLANNYASADLLVEEAPTATPTPSASTTITPEPSAPATGTPEGTPTESAAPTAVATPTVEDRPEATQTPQPATPAPATATPGPTAVPTVPPLLLTLRADVAQVEAETEQIHYLLRVANTSRAALEALMLRESVPHGTEFVAASSANEWQCDDAGQAGAACSLEISRLESGQVISIDFVVALQPLSADITQIENRAQVVADTANIQASAELIIPVQMRINRSSSSGKTLHLPLLHK